MSLELWTRTSGTWINVMTVILGTGLGLFLAERLSSRIQQIIPQGLGLITLFIGIRMAGSLTQAQGGKIDGVILGLLALVIGGLLGEWWGIEKKLTQVGDWLKQKFRGKGKFTEGFVAASLLFCIGPMALIGSINNGLTGDNTLLTLKATMDGLASIALTGSYGIGVGFSTLSLLVYQGGISLSAGILSQVIPDPSTSPPVLLLTGVGGMMVLGIGMMLLEIGNVRVASFLPALLVAPLLWAIANWSSSLG